jgi:uncharacterized protein (TIRG00374 family)
MPPPCRLLSHNGPRKVETSATYSAVVRGKSNPLFRLFPYVIVAVAAIVFIAANREDVPATLRAIRQARTPFLLAALLLTLAALGTQIALHTSAQQTVGIDVSARQLAGPIVVGGFLNLVVKSGGMAGLAPLLGAARRRGQARGNTIAGYLLVNVLGHVAFVAALFASIVMLVMDGRFSRVDAGATLVFLLLTAVQVVALVAALRSRDAVRRLYTLPHRLRDAVLRRRQRNPSDTDDDRVTSADDLFDAVQLVRSRPRAALPSMTFALLVEVIGMAQLWCVLKALGESPGIVVPVVAYSVSVLFTIVGVLPGGLGFVEVGLAAVLVSFGSAGTVAAAAVVLYRVCELWIPSLFGLIASHRFARLEPR